jgi:hypothetical protein
MRRVERPDLRIHRTYGAPSAVSGDTRFVLKRFEIIGDLRCHPSCFEYDATTTRRFGQFVGDRLRGPGESYSDVILRVAAEGVERE